MKKLETKSLLSRIIFIGFVFLLFSCKPYFNITGSFNKSYSDNAGGIKSFNPKRPLIINFTGNIKVNTKKQRVSGKFYVDTNNIFQIFIYSSAIGIEIARIQCSGDSIFFVDKISKVFFNGLINNFRVFDNSGINSKVFLNLLFGGCVKSREFYEGGLVSDCDVDNFGFLRDQNFEYDNVKINILYSNYLKKYNIPYQISGSIKQSSKVIVFELNVGNIIKNKKGFKKLKCPDYYTELK